MPVGGTGGSVNGILLHHVDLLVSIIHARFRANLHHPERRVPAPAFGHFQPHAPGALLLLQFDAHHAGALHHVGGTLLTPEARSGAEVPLRRIDGGSVELVGEDQVPAFSSVGGLNHNILAVQQLTVGIG